MVISVCNKAFSDLSLKLQYVMEELFDPVLYFRKYLSNTLSANLFLCSSIDSTKQNHLDKTTVFIISMSYLSLFPLFLFTPYGCTKNKPNK